MIAILTLSTTTVPVASHDVQMKVEHYRKQWMKEQEHYKVISENLMEVKTEVHDLKLKVEIVENETIPKTQKLVKTISQGDQVVRINHYKGNKREIITMQHWLMYLMVTIIAGVKQNTI